MLKDFRDFVMQGNVIDIAIAFVIGVAFTAIVTSLVDDIIMPVVGVILGGVDFTSLAITVGDASITYGNFIQTIIDFLIIAFFLFLIVRSINQLKGRLAKEEAEAAAAPAEISSEEKLLTEIRDLLKEK